MPLFRYTYITIKGKKYTGKIEVDAKGNFSIDLQINIAAALGVERTITGKDADTVDHAWHKQMRKFDKLTVKSEYRIKYRFALSNRIRMQMPGKIMTDDAWSMTQRIGSEYMPEKSLSIIVDWFPYELRYKGKELVESRLKVPEEDDWAITNAEEALQAGKHAELYLSHIHKIYDGLILVHDERHWEFDSKDVYRSIPLTKETFDFFSSIEISFVQMMTKMFAFLNRDEKLLMDDIQKAIANGSFKLLGE